MSEGTVRLAIPLGDRHLVFSHWLPFAADALTIPATEESYAVRVWVDVDCLAHIGGVNREDVPRHLNLKVEKLLVEVALGFVDDDLAALITSGRHSPGDGSTNHAATRQ